jgi:serine/threonine-protein kinase
MLNDAEKRAARLAVTRYGADRTRVEQAVQAVLRARAGGKDADLFDTLAGQGLLNSAQAGELRQSLEKTQIDPTSPVGEATARQRKNNASDGEITVAVKPAINGNGPTPDSGELRYLGDYRLLRRLGEGGMGSVYLGYKESEDRKVAIKILPDHLAGSQASVDRFYREAKSVALLNHPNIVHYIMFGQDQATHKLYLVLEYVAGPSAHALLDRFGKLSVGDAVHIALDVARALEYAHSRNIVHRDIKPDNILITPSGLAKLADLSLAKRTDETSHLTATRQGFGTPYYMPYEQAMNAKYADGRSDIYALGATLYHLLVGEVPFSGVNHLEILDKKSLGFFAPASSVNPEVPRELDGILDKMLARDPQDRYQTASELIVDLERANLSAPVPSFVDAELALQDPVVRERLAVAAQPTCLDMSAAAAPLPAPAADDKPDVWYLRYRDRKGQLCKAKATTQQVLQRLRDGKLVRDVEASHEAQGEYQTLGDYPEFRAAVLAAKARGKARKLAQTEGPDDRPPALNASDEMGSTTMVLPTRWWLLVVIGIGLAAGGVVLLKVFWA